MNLIMISSKRHSKLKRSVLTLVMAVAVASLSACGGGKKISTKDSSADYKSAKSLAPLKKPSRAIVTENSKLDQSLANVVRVDEKASISSTGSSGQSADQLDVSVSSEIITAKSGQSVLALEADFDKSWAFLTASLQKSDLTVFSRNKTAGRFSIGCSLIEEPTVVKSGRWSIFNRSKPKDLEHCALEAVTKRGKTLVSVLNRTGGDVASESSIKVFNQIIK